MDMARNEKIKLEFQEKMAKMNIPLHPRTMHSNKANSFIDVTAGSKLMDMHKITSLRTDWLLCYYYLVKNDLIRCVYEIISREVGQMEYVVKRTDGKVLKNDRMQKLLQRKLQQVDFQSLMAEAIPWAAIFGNGLIRINRTKIGSVDSFDNISWLSITPVIDGMTTKLKGFTYLDGAKIYTLDLDDCIRILPYARDPGNTDFGLPRICACKDSLGITDEWYSHLTILLRNGNHDGTIINFKSSEQTDQGALDEVMDQTESDINSKENVGKASVLKDAEIHTAATNNATPFGEVPDITAKQVSRTFLIPEEEINIAKSGQLGSNRATSDKDRLDSSILSNYVKPALRCVNKKWLQEEGGIYDYYIAPARDIVPVGLDRSRAISTMWRDGMITFAEARTLAGLKITDGDDRNNKYYLDLQPDTDPLTDTTPGTDNTDGESNGQRRRS
jgi:hypothetical protein